MNKKAEIEISPGVIILAAIGAILSFIIAKSMHPGAIWVILSTLGGGGVGIMIGNMAANN